MAADIKPLNAEELKSFWTQARQYDTKILNAALRSDLYHWAMLAKAEHQLQHGDQPVLARALTNMEFKRLIGVGAGRRAVTIHKIINVAAPVEGVFAFWSYYQNFPRFMSNVREIQETGNSRSIPLDRSRSGRSTKLINSHRFSYELLTSMIASPISDRI